MNEAARAAALASGISPLDFLLATMRDEAHEYATRLDAAKAAAPYVHAKLASVEHSGGIGVATMTHEEWLASLK